MARYFTMPFGGAGVFEGDIYKGTAISAALYGVLRLEDKDSTAEYHYHPTSGQFLQEGWRFGRRMLTQNEVTGEPLTFDAWRPLHAQGQPENTYEKTLVKMDFEVKVAAGVNMKDPDGFLIWFQGGVVAQPASGQQARDPWTGALLWLNPPTNTIPQLEP